MFVTMNSLPDNIPCNRVTEVKLVRDVTEQRSTTHQCERTEHWKIESLLLNRSDAVMMVHFYWHFRLEWWALQEA